MYDNETIAAIATGLAEAGIGIIRISGGNAVEIGDRLFRSPSEKKILRDAKSHTMYYGYIVDKDLIIDEAMAVVMRAPRSFTGEDTVEIHCHGGLFVVQKILTAVLQSGARHAAPGEFTKRAFLNRRMDLSRAEAVMDVIHSQNEDALAASVSQLQGRLEKEIRRLRGEILYEIALIESALDDPEHITLEGYREKLAEKLDELLKSIRRLILTADEGKLVKEGIRTVILGKPNVGKSSLLNLLAGEERAIVTETPGTTRDLLCETVRIHGITLHITDTAGIRDTEEKIERIGIEKAKKFAREADLILYVADSSIPLDGEDEKVISLIRDKNVIVLLNKIDLPCSVKRDDIIKIMKKYNLPCVTGQEKTDGFSEENNGKTSIIETSIRDESGMEELGQKIRDMFFRGEIKTHDEIIITNIRHREALEEAEISLQMVKKSLEQGMPEDFYSIDLMNAYTALGRIIGEEVDDDLIEEIFSKFCVGK